MSGPLAWLMLAAAVVLVLAIVMGIWFLFDTDPDNDDHWGR